jgi:2-polyprenyl-3-methyl-5-hydroxy-6-metoxy-1,4-benzoquinol methylase
MAMPGHTIENFGWRTAQETSATGYVAPRVEGILKGLDAKRVADLGAGNGVICGRLSALGYEVVGVEYDKAGVDIARTAFPSVKFYNFSFEDDPADLLASESPFDAVVSTEVLEHLYFPHRLPIYAGSILKPGGHLIVSAPYHGYLKNLALSLFNAWDHHHTTLWHGGHIKFWSRKTLTALLEQNGFQVVGFRGAGRCAYLWKSMILVAKKV